MEATRETVYIVRKSLSVLMTSSHCACAKINIDVCKNGNKGEQKLFFDNHVFGDCSQEFDLNEQD